MNADILYEYLDEDVDGDNSYKWKNVVRLGAADVGAALKNADNLAYAGVAAMLVSRGYTVNGADGVVVKI